MAVFPTLPGIKRNIERNVNKPEIKSKFEGNYAQTRPVYTRANYDFKIEFVAISISEVDVLEEFFIAHKGGSFDWVNPQDNKTYLVRFVDEKLSSKMIKKEKYTVSIALEQV